MNKKHKKLIENAIRDASSKLRIHVNDNVLGLICMFVIHSSFNETLYNKSIAKLPTMIVPSKFIIFNNKPDKKNACLKCSYIPRDIKIQKLPHSWGEHGEGAYYTCEPCGIEYIYKIHKLRSDGSITLFIKHTAYPPDISPTKVMIL